MSPTVKKPSATQSPQPSYSFHGSNSSHSKDNGSGGRTYHIPNYATSYANEKSNLISVTFDEDKASSNAILRIVVMFLFFAAVPLSIMAWKPSNLHHINAQAEPSPKNVGPPVHASGGHGEESYVNLINPADQDRQNEHSSSKSFWDEPLPNARCLAYRKREYTARLRNVPFFVNWIEACEKTQVSIHGVVIASPSFCENKWPFGGVIGHWIVDSGEKDCSAHWGRISDKGCVDQKSKLRRFRAQLHGIKKMEDWLALCNTVPANIHEMSIAKPTHCENQGFWGVYATWDLEDADC